MKKTGNTFFGLALIALLAGAFFGTMATIQYLNPDFMKGILAFNKMRPFHISSVVGWIILGATGGIYYYLSEVLNLKPAAPKLAQVHLWIFILCIVAIYLSLLSGKTGGREYLAYAPIISIPILLGWILFGFNYFKTVLKQVKGWPVYLWMWGTGIVFMIYHFSEAHFWLIPHFRENFVRDISVQWKSYGSFVGSWNMLVYGTATFLMAKIKNDDHVARGKRAFFFYFLGLTNLMLGWAHHTYIIPTQPWVRYLAYGVSMTEWIIFVSMIISWKRSLTQGEIKPNHISYKFLLATDFWVFVNLFLALLISIPVINIFTHGTHITVAHSMGTTIGINTTILLASAFFMFTRQNPLEMNKIRKYVIPGYWIFNISLAVFFLCLIFAGMEKSYLMYFVNEPVSFGTIHEQILPFMVPFLIAGYGIFAGLLLIVLPLLKVILIERFRKSQ